jgi:hypothetical protein
MRVLLVLGKDRETGSGNMISVAKLNVNGGYVGKERCDVPRPLLEAMIEAARSSKDFLVIFADNLAPLWAGKYAWEMENVATGIRATLGLVPMSNLRAYPNVFTMLPDKCDREEHKPSVIRSQHIPSLRNCLPNRTRPTIRAVSRTDFYQIAGNPGIRRQLKIPENISVVTVKTRETAAYANLGLLVAPAQSSLLQSLPRCLPKELIGLMSELGHQSSIVVMNEAEYAKLPKRIESTKEVFKIRGGYTEEVVKAILMLWEPDPAKYVVAEGSAPNASVAVEKGDSSGLLGRLTEEYPDCAGFFSKGDLPRYLRNDLCKAVVVVKKGPTVIIRNGVSGATGGF